jgi:uncharacterized membrane protein
MVFPLLISFLIGLGLLIYGIVQRVRYKQQQERIFILLGAAVTLVILCLIAFSLWVFASGM